MEVRYNLLSQSGSNGLFHIIILNEISLVIR